MLKNCRLKKEQFQFSVDTVSMWATSKYFQSMCTICPLCTVSPTMYTESPNLDIPWNQWNGNISIDIALLNCAYSIGAEKAAGMSTYLCHDLGFLTSL